MAGQRREQTMADRRVTFGDISAALWQTHIINPVTNLWDRVQKHSVHPHHTHYWSDEEQCWYEIDRGNEKPPEPVEERPWYTFYNIDPKTAAETKWNLMVPKGLVEQADLRVSASEVE